MLRNPKTALFIFVLAILCFAGFSYYNAQAAIFKKPATDITYADLGKLKGKVHVTMDVDHGKIFIESLGKTGLSVNLYSGKYIVLKNSKELNTKRFTLLFVGILLIVVGVAYLLLVYHPFNRE